MLSNGIWTYTWQHGRELASMSSGSVTWNFTYNADDLRTRRTDGTTTYDYTYNGSTLTQMRVGSDVLHFVYDASGMPMAVTYNGTNYYYVTNLQGDVVAILNEEGTAVVTYTYDAWGNILTTGGEMADTLSAVNPLRYRGYVYDQETQLYYLQSRYYDPDIGRFINADVYAATGQGFIGNNTFAYCGNNPICRIDNGGDLWAVVGAAIGGAVAGAIIGSVSYLVSSGINKSTVTGLGLLNAAATGAITGAIGAIGGFYGGVCAIVASLGVGIVSGVTTTINTDGSTTEKLVSGGFASLVAGFGTYWGAKIPVATDHAFTSGVTSYAGGLFSGAITESVNVASQNLTHNIFSPNAGTSASLQSISTPSYHKPTFSVMLPY